jgi:hypothetical protein
MLVGNVHLNGINANVDITFAINHFKNFVIGCGKVVGI